MDSALLELIRARRVELERDEGEAWRQILIAFESMRSNEIEEALEKILQAYIEGRGVQAAQFVDREEVRTPSDNMSADEIEAALVKVLAEHGITVSDGDATAKPR